MHCGSWMITSRLTDADDIELEASLQELALNLGGDAVETDVTVGEHRGAGHGFGFQE